MTILEKLRTALPDMAPTAQKIALFILDHGQDAAFLSIYEMSAAIGVSNATLIRFVRGQGFKGYADFKHALQDDIRFTLDPYKKIAMSELDKLSNNEQLAKLVQNETNNLKKTLNDLDAEVLERIAGDIEKAGRIFLCGFGATRYFVQGFAHALRSTLDKDIGFLSGSVSDYVPLLKSFHSEDVLILCTFPPYSREGSHVATVAKERKGKVFLFTDSMRCPVTPLADVVVKCVNNSMLLMNSFVSLVMVLQILANMICLSIGEIGARERDGMYKLEQAGYKAIGGEGKDK
jgi:DNA-binding MurR/RpiR family transcriptional regulator